MNKEMSNIPITFELKKFLIEAKIEYQRAIEEYNINNEPLIPSSMMHGLCAYLHYTGYQYLYHEFTIILKCIGKGKLTLMAGHPESTFIPAFRFQNQKEGLQFRVDLIDEILSLTNEQTHES